MSSKFMRKSIITVLLFTVFLSVFTGISVFPVAAKKQHEISTDVLILTNREDKSKSAVGISLGLDDRINTTIFGALDDHNGAILEFNISAFDVVVIDCYLPKNSTDKDWLFNQIINNNIGLLFFGGNYTTGAGDFETIIPAYFSVDRDAVNQSMAEAIIDSTNFSGELAETYLDLVYADTEAFDILSDQVQVDVTEEEEGRNSMFSTNVAWESCPLLADRVSTFAKKPTANTIVEVPNTQEPLMVVGNMSKLQTSVASNASVIFISTGVGVIEEYDDDEKKMVNVTMNEAFSLWPYFNYLMYMSVYYLTYEFDDSLIESYADWPWSPIPHETEATLWMIFVGALWVFNFVLFFTLGRKKKAKDAAEALANENEVKIESNLTENTSLDNISTEPIQEENVE